MWSGLLRWNWMLLTPGRFKCVFWRGVCPCRRWRRKVSASLSWSRRNRLWSSSCLKLELAALMIAALSTPPSSDSIRHHQSHTTLNHLRPRGPEPSYGIKTWLTRSSHDFTWTWDEQKNKLDSSAEQRNTSERRLRFISSVSSTWTECLSEQLISEGRYLRRLFRLVWFHLVCFGCGALTSVLFSLKG